MAVADRVATDAAALAHLHARDLPAGRRGDIRIEHRVCTEEDARRMELSYAIHGHRTRIRAGTYTTLYEGDTLWMSDTPDEVHDHYTPVLVAKHTHAARVLINGLGIGVVVNAMLHLPEVAHVDVVEAHPDVIALVGPHYQAVAAAQGKTLVVHHDDAYTIRWPPKTWWDVVWHDVWPTITAENLPEMARLHRRYGGRCRWQGSWKRATCELMRERERRWY